MRSWSRSGMPAETSVERECPAAMASVAARNWWRAAEFMGC